MHSSVALSEFDRLVPEYRTNQTALLRNPYCTILLSSGDWFNNGIFRDSGGQCITRIYRSSIYSSIAFGSIRSRLIMYLVGKESPPQPSSVGRSNRESLVVTEHRHLLITRNRVTINTDFSAMPLAVILKLVWKASSPKQETKPGIILTFFIRCPVLRRGRSRLIWGYFSFPVNPFDTLVYPAKTQDGRSNSVNRVKKNTQTYECRHADTCHRRDATISVSRVK